MTERETLERAKMYMEKLANGINPIDESVIPDEDVVNNVRLSRCFFYVADVLQKVIDKGGIEPKRKTQKQAFQLSIEKRKDFAFSNVPINITEFVKRINDLNEDECMAKLKTSMVTDWLISLGMLQIELNAKGKHVKWPTPQGNALGITLQSRTGMYGTYYSVVYNLEAQHFLLDNLDGAIEMDAAKKENQGHPWSQEQDRCLQDLYQKNVQMKEIAITLKRSVKEVRARLKRLGVTE